LCSISARAAHRSPSEDCIDEDALADGTLSNQFLGLCEADRAPSLATDLNDPAILAGRLDDLESLLDLMSHRLFAVDVFTSVTGVHDDLLMPVIGHGNDHAINVLVVEQVPVATRSGHRLA